MATELRFMSWKRYTKMISKNLKKKSRKKGKEIRTRGRTESPLGLR